MRKPIAYPVAAAIVMLGGFVSLLEALFLPADRHTHFYGPYH